MRVDGTIMKVEHKKGDFTPEGQTEKVPYDFYVYHVWDGDQMREVRLPKDVTPEALPYAVGDRIDWEIRVPKGVRIFLDESEVTGALKAAS